MFITTICVYIPCEIEHDYIEFITDNCESVKMYPSFNENSYEILYGLNDVEKKYVVYQFQYGMKPIDCLQLDINIIKNNHTHMYSDTIQFNGEYKNKHNIFINDL
jgi:hypothetical protein